MSQFAVDNEWCFCSSKKQREEWWGEKQNGSFSCISSFGMKIHCVTVAESPTSIVFFLLSALSGVGGLCPFLLLGCGGWVCFLVITSVCLFLLSYPLSMASVSVRYGSVVPCTATKSVPPPEQDIEYKNECYISWGHLHTAVNRVGCDSSAYVFFFNR